MTASTAARNHTRDWGAQEQRRRDQRVEQLEQRNGGRLARRNRPATDKQRRYIAFLAMKAGVTARPVGSRQDASGEVGRLKSLL
jgi:hypothetical protein